MSHCAYCDAPVDMSAKYCSNCAHPISESIRQPRSSASSVSGAITSPKSLHKPIKRNTKKVLVATIAYVVILVASFVVVAHLIYNDPSRLPPESLIEETPLQVISVGERWLSNSNYWGAIEKFERLIEIYPSSPRGYTGAAEAYVLQGELDKAESVLRHGLIKLPGNALIIAALEAVEVSAHEVATYPPNDINVTSITIKGVEYSTTLQWLDLGEMELTDSDIAPLIYMTDLTYLRLDDNQISDLNPLSGLTNLTFLSLAVNQISDLSPLSGLTNLTSLSLRDNRISDISPLIGLTHLSLLELAANEISNIDALTGMTNLSLLGLSGNQVSDISILSGLTSISGLILDNNQVSDLTPLADLENLTILVLMGNPLITDEKVDELKAALPDCEIHY